MKKKVLQERLNNLEGRIKILSDKIDYIREFNDNLPDVKIIENKINLQDKIIKLILEELKKEVVKEDYIAEKIDFSHPIDGSWSDIDWLNPPFIIKKKVVETRLKLINKKYDKSIK